MITKVVIEGIVNYNTKYNQWCVGEDSIDSIIPDFLDRKVVVTITEI